MQPELKRQNFNITPEQDTELAWLRDALGASSIKDVILRAVQLLATVVRESQRGNRLYLGSSQGPSIRILLPELERSAPDDWKYLVSRPHPWRRQLYIKGKRLLAATVWRDMQTNGMSAEEAGRNWDLPLEAIEESRRYCQSHEELLRLEAEEERTRLESALSKPSDSK